ncbi:hypothetical protein DFH08DRAFT_966578 [Mycena albidolilacea]|uniref:Uncharacterized protein n=1 Tax=Mycena albidolilacea TaxID=1033008 RepID=A0AAD7EJE3_9AGAR|nr:hypothetical protein DFH08DRAFT_966578 [Mycena albidolilacea]
MATSFQIATYLRIAAYAIGLFDYLEALPAEIRLYAKQKGPFKRFSACILFIMQGVMQHFYWLKPVFKRTVPAPHPADDTGHPDIRCITQVHSSPALSLVCALVECISTFWKRLFFQKDGSDGNLPGVKIASLYSVGFLAFDVVAMGITLVYLCKFSNKSQVSLSGLVGTMLEDGIMYFVALTAMNMLNSAFLQS